MFNIFCVSLAQILIYSLYDSRQLKSIRALVAESHHVSRERKERKFISGTVETLYKETIWIEFKTTAKNTVLHGYPKDHIFYTLYTFLQYDTVYGLKDRLSSFKKNKIWSLLCKRRIYLCLNAVKHNSKLNINVSVSKNVHSLSQKMALMRKSHCKKHTAFDG